MTRLDEIARERYDSGAHERCHLVMNRATRDRLRRENSPATSTPPDVVSTMMGIPIVLDNTMAVDAWRLVATYTGDVIEVGAS